MTRLELFQIMRDIVMTVTGIDEVILADDRGPSPQGEYASIEPFQSIKGRGQPYIRPANSGSEDVDQSIETRVIVECPVNFYRGDDPRARAMQLINANKRSVIAMKLFQATPRVGWQNTGPVNNLSGLQSHRVEQRANISIFLMFTEIPTDTLNAICSSGIIIEDEQARILSETEI